MRLDTRRRGEYDKEAVKRDCGYIEGDLTRPVWGRLASLLSRLQPYFVHWKFSFIPGDDMEYEPGIDRATTDIGQANVISSEITSGVRSLAKGKYHAVLLDLDIPAWLVPSSREGHSHLYIDAAVPHDKYMALLKSLADCGIIEKGYADVSIARGHSDLRLPWVRKEDQDTSDNSGTEILNRIHNERAALERAKAGPVFDLLEDF